MVDTVYWLRGYVIRSRIMEYYGCYSLTKVDSTIKHVKNNTFENNTIIPCSTSCDGADGDFMFLANTTCYCVNDKTYKQWKKLKYVKEISSDQCNLECPDDEYNRCGSDIDTTIFSVYMFKPVNPEPIFKAVGQYCFYVDAFKVIKYKECSDQLKFKCQKLQLSDGERTWDSMCYHWFSNWYDARKICKRDGKFLQTYPGGQCNGNNIPDTDETWHNRFLTEKIIWNKDDPTYNSCLSLLVTSKGDLKLETRDCNEKHKTLCRNAVGGTSTEYKETTVFTEFNTDTSDTNKTVTQNNEGPLIGGAVGGLLAVIFLEAVMVSILKGKHQGTQDKQPTKLSVYYSAVAENDKARLVPNPPSTTSEYMYVKESDINRPTNDHSDYTYNILHEDERRRQDNTSGPIYDHSGVKDGDYDLTNASNDRLDDTVHNVYDDSRALENLYDETTQGKRTDNIMPSIYDHV